MKYEWKKQEKEIYFPKESPSLVNIPKAKYLCIKGKGNPNNEDFANRVGVLYLMSYAIKMMPKNGFTPEGYYDYTVYPLEGLWDLTEEGKKESKLKKEELLYTIMIKQPDYADDNVFQKALEISKKKKHDPLLNEVTFEEIEDGLSVQILHIGSYDNEPFSFDKMKTFINENNLTIKTLVHREIYLSDNRKVEKDKLKTILRYLVKK